MATAATKTPYDPVKSAEGMFYGSVQRLAYVLKDPDNFGQSSKLVLAETVKRFQDVLDDCEIQILDAKWYLEQQLAANKARREAKAREEGAASAKRKHDEIKEAADKQDVQQAEQAAKRLKTEESSAEEATAPDLSIQIDGTTEKPSADSPSALVKKSSESIAKNKIEIKQQESQASDQTKETTAPANPPDQTGTEPQPQPQPSADEFPKQSPPASPPMTGTNEEFHFVSMFGEPTGDATDDLTGGATNDNNIDDDLNFGLDLVGDDAITNLNDSSNLDSFLPNTTDTLNATQSSNQNTAAAAAAAAVAVTNNPLDLPDLPDLNAPNDFDDFLAQTDFADTNTNFDENVNLSDEAMLNMDMDLEFDSLFN